MWLARQGDVAIRRVKSIPTDAKPAKKADAQGNPRIVLAYGEVTGHAHAIHDLDNVDVFVTATGTMYLHVKEPAPMTHEEHGAIPLGAELLPPGNYQRVQQVEYSPEAIVNVQD